jgi:hypothetical protein
VIILATTSVLVPISRANVDSGYISLLSQLDANGALKHVEQLAGDSFEGRRAGTQGADLASDYIADYFSSIGLKPAGTDGSYKTKFTMPLWDLVQIPSLTLTNSNGTVLSVFGYRGDFNVIPGSGGGDYTGRQPGVRQYSAQRQRFQFVIASAEDRSGPNATILCDRQSASRLSEGDVHRVCIGVQRPCIHPRFRP